MQCNIHGNQKIFSCRSVYFLARVRACALKPPSCAWWSKIFPFACLQQIPKTTKQKDIKYLCRII